VNTQGFFTYQAGARARIFIYHIWSATLARHTSSASTAKTAANASLAAACSAVARWTSTPVPATDPSTTHSATHTRGAAGGGPPPRSAAAAAAAASTAASPVPPEMPMRADARTGCEEEWPSHPPARTWRPRYAIRRWSAAVRISRALALSSSPTRRGSSPAASMAASAHWVA